MKFKGVYLLRDDTSTSGSIGILVKRSLCEDKEKTKKCVCGEGDEVITTTCLSSCLVLT